MDKQYSWKISFEKILIYIFAFLIIISNSIYTYTVNNTFNYILKTIITFFPIIFFAYKKIYLQRVNRCALIMLLYFVLIVIYHAAGVREALFSYGMRFYIFIPLMIIFFLSCGDKYSLFRALANIMVLLAAIFLVFWIFCTVLKIIPATGLFYTTWGNHYIDHWFYMYFEVPATAQGLPFYRNVGFFGEAPAYCFFLCIALTTEIFLKRARKINIVILVLAILSTVSTTGFLVLVSCCVVMVWNYMKSHRKNRLLKYITMILMVVMASLFISRIMGHSSKVASVQIRVRDYANGWKTFMESPLVGCGYKNQDVSMTGSSNSFSLILASGGVLLGFIYFYPMLYSVFLYAKWKKSMNMYWGLSVIGLFCISIVGYTYFILAFLALGYAVIIDKEGEFKVGYKNICCNA